MARSLLNATVSSTLIANVNTCYTLHPSTHTRAGREWHQQTTNTETKKGSQPNIRAQCMLFIQGTRSQNKNK